MLGSVLRNDPPVITQGIICFAWNQIRINHMQSKLLQSLVPILLIDTNYIKLMY